ncbi:MAG: hypothetical protein ACOYD4_06905 [Solirubrobacterales bacterium]
MASTVARAERLAKARQSLIEAIAVLASAFGIEAPEFPKSKDAAIEQALHAETVAVFLLDVARHGTVEQKIRGKKAEAN